MIRISRYKSSKITAKDKDFDFLTIRKGIQNLTKRSFPDIYTSPLKTRVFDPKIEFRDEYASFTLRNSELF